MHQHGMNCLEPREGGWRIGSGMVESGAKQFKARSTGPACTGAALTLRDPPQN
jgi:hypothetical protein